MSTGGLWLMAGIGVLALLAGLGLVATARTHAKEAARYVSRLAGVMVCAVGLILIVFAASWVFWSD